MAEIRASRWGRASEAKGAACARTCDRRKFQGVGEGVWLGPGVLRPYPESRATIGEFLAEGERCCLCWRDPLLVGTGV